MTPEPATTTTPIQSRTESRVSEVSSGLAVVSSALRSRSLVEGLPVAANRQGAHHDREERQGPEVRQHVDDAVALEEDAADETEGGGQREHLADDPCPLRHSGEREHETREQDGREDEEHRHLHGLELIPGERGEGEAHCEVRGDEQSETDEEQEERATHRHLEHAHCRG